MSDSLPRQQRQDCACCFWAAWGQEEGPCDWCKRFSVGLTLPRQIRYPWSHIQHAPPVQAAPQWRAGSQAWWLEMEGGGLGGSPVHPSTRLAPAPTHTGWWRSLRRLRSSPQPGLLGPAHFAALKLRNSAEESCQRELTMVKQPPSCLRSHLNVAKAMP